MCSGTNCVNVKVCLISRAEFALEISNVGIGESLSMPQEQLQAVVRFQKLSYVMFCGVKS